MNATLKTLILAAAGAALIAASPASAQTQKQTQVQAQKRATVERSVVPMMLEVPPTWQYGAWQYGETSVNSADTYGQIRGEYLKDAPTHNGNAY
jgi:hypothetical protein